MALSFSFLICKIKEIGFCLPWYPFNLKLYMVLGKKKKETIFSKTWTKLNNLVLILLNIWHQEGKAIYFCFVLFCFPSSTGSLYCNQREVTTFVLKKCIENIKFRNIERASYWMIHRLTLIPVSYHARIML